MPFAIGDRVHIQDLGTGEVLEVRNRRRYVVMIKGRTLIVSETQITAADAAPRGRRASRPSSSSAPDAGRSSSAPPMSAPTLDLHGHTVDDAVAALLSFLNDALLAGAAEAQVIHGKSGGKLRAAVHAQLRSLSAVKRFGIDPRNPGVTIVRF